MEIATFQDDVHPIQANACPPKARIQPKHKYSRKTSGEQAYHKAGRFRAFLNKFLEKIFRTLESSVTGAITSKFTPNGDKTSPL
jgi:hypothetical protein